jgi:hypothetical protein
MQGSPTAASWGLGRIDVFVMGGGNELAHKAFANGQWSAWENLGGILTSSPTATSSGSNRLNVFVRGTDGQLWHRWYAYGWGGWEPLGGATIPEDHFDLDYWAPSATSRQPYSVDVFLVRGEFNDEWNQISFDNGWSGPRFRGRLAGHRAAVTYWIPYVPPPPDDPSCAPYPICP